MTEWITNMPFEKAISYLVFLGFLAFNAKEIQKMLKGGNGMWQQIEVLTAICLLFFIFYGIEIVFGHIEADHFVLSIFLIGAGGAQIIKEAKNIMTSNGDKKSVNSDDSNTDRGSTHTI